MPPAPIGSCYKPDVPPAGTCTEYYSMPLALASLCEAIHGTQTTTGCPTANLLGFCALKPPYAGIKPVYYSYYYGAAGSSASFETDCTNGGSTWCPAP